jgi:cobaltochelatase CobN
MVEGHHQNRSALRCPPLSCRTSPPQGGRSAAIDDFANRLRCRLGAGKNGRPISPLAGEMSGRTEGGATERDLPEERYAS